MLPWSEVIDPVADQNGFAGVVSVHRGGETEFARAYGLADRARQIPNTVRTRFAIASGTKGLTALAVVSLINDNALAMSTTARSVLGADLPLIGDDVTIEHLLAHRSGIGDYLDEEAGHDVTDYTLTVPPQDLGTTEGYLAVLGGYPAKFRPGAEAFHEVRSRRDASPHRISVAADAPRPGPGERTAHRPGGHPADPPARDRPRHPPRVAAFQAGAFPLAREKPEGHPCIVCPHAAGGQTISSSPMAGRGLYQLTYGRVRWRLAWRRTCRIGARDD